MQAVPKQLWIHLSSRAQTAPAKQKSKAQPSFMIDESSSLTSFKLPSAKSFFPA
jgi:hypothetical protein